MHGLMARSSSLCVIGRSRAAIQLLSAADIKLLAGTVTCSSDKLPFRASCDTLRTTSDWTAKRW